MKMISLLQIIIYTLFGIILRIIFYYSKYKDYLKSLLIFDQSSYNFDNLRENYIYNLFHKISSIETKENGFAEDKQIKPLNDNNYYSEYEFISKPLTIVYTYIRHYPKEYIFAFFIICDLIIAYLISIFKYHFLYKNDEKEEKLEKKDDDNENNENNENINLGVFCFYLCNPVSITTCISFNLDVVFTLINLLIPYFEDNIILCPILIVSSIILSPGYIFVTLIYFIFLLSCNFRKYQKNIFISFLLLLLYFKYGQRLNYLPFESLKNLYYNYYWFKDLRPNFGLLWVLLPSTFLKYQNYTLMMFLVYQLTLSIAVMLSVNRIQNKDYKYKKSLAYILIFYISHILDRYPCENHLVVILCILLQHYEIIKVKIFDLGVYCAFASYTLIVCRGFPYTHRRSGSSNYLFYQNLTYALSQVMIVMFSLTGINNYRLEHKPKENKEKGDEDKRDDVKKEDENKNDKKEEKKEILLNENENEEEKLKKKEDIKEEEMKKEKKEKKENKKNKKKEKNNKQKID
jgi:hypothetical protein